MGGAPRGDQVQWLALLRGTEALRPEALLLPLPITVLVAQTSHPAPTTFHQAGTQLYNMYPPASLEQAIGSLFLQGSTQDSAWRAKLAVMLYYLQDAGHVELHKSFRFAGSANRLI